MTIVHHHVPITPTPRRRLLPACVAALALARVAAAAPAADMGLHDDPVLSRLVDDSLATRRELKQVEALVAAQRERVPQVGALPDPTLGFGIQNDSFNRWNIGRMDTSFYQVILSQGLPFPGKRDLRTQDAGLSAQQAETSIARARLSTEAEVRRAYLDLLLARERLQLLQRLEIIWQQAAGVAGTRYETGEGAQSDVLRAQLEVSRIAQRRALLQGEERMRVQLLNRLRHHPFDEPIASGASVRDLVPAGTPETAALEDDAIARSPELAQARLGVARAGKQVELAERDRWPDFGVNVGLMPRGALEPMWSVGFSMGLPVWMDRKQGRAVLEDTERAVAESEGAAELEHLLRLRVAERRSAHAALVETIRIYRTGLLVRSQATVDSTLSQYRVGRLPFVSVLEANAGYIDDEDGYLVALAAAQRLAIAAREVSLEPVTLTVGGESMGSAGGAGGAGAGVPPAGAAAAPAAAEQGNAGGGAPGM